jgi:hypothetical protein
MGRSASTEGSIVASNAGAVMGLAGADRGSVLSGIGGGGGPLFRGGALFRPVPVGEAPDMNVVGFVIVRDGLRRVGGRDGEVVS